ncbi:MAG: hypothetical protein U0694_18305 [Anaerolineae bacterium]
MPLFVIFVFGAVILGSGALLSPALPTSQPRIGLAAAFSLALIIGGAIFWAMLFGWDVLLIDYMVFFLISVIFLGGTLSYGQKRAEARGTTLDDADQGWPGPTDLALLAVVALLLIGMVMFLPIPPTVSAEPPTRATLSNEPPAFRALVAYLGQQLTQPMDITQYATGAVLVMLCVWLSIDLGVELRDKPFGRVLMAVTLVIGAALLRMGSYQLLMGAVFALAFSIFALHYTRHQYPIDGFMAGLMLGATLLSHVPLCAVMLLGYGLALLLLALRRSALGRRAWAMLVLGVPLVAVAATSPWLVWR